MIEALQLAGQGRGNIVYYILDLDLQVNVQ